MAPTTKSSPLQTSQSEHYASSCGRCGQEYLAKAGATCPYCGGISRQGEEYTRKTFGADDHDLKKGF